MSGTRIVALRAYDPDEQAWVCDLLSRVAKPRLLGKAMQRIQTLPFFRLLLLLFHDPHGSRIPGYYRVWEFGLGFGVCVKANPDPNHNPNSNLNLTLTLTLTSTLTLALLPLP